MKDMKLQQMDTTKDAIKLSLESVAEKTGAEWHAQQTHKLAVALFFLDMLEITEQADRDAALKQWVATPASFGCNASAMGQALGRESGKTKLDKVFAGL